MSGLSPEQLRFTLAYRRLLRVSELAHRLPLPGGARRMLADLIGQRFSPYRQHMASVLAGLHQGLGLQIPEVRRNARLWFGSHGRFAASVFDYPRMDAAWVRREVAGLDNPDLQVLLQQGGLVLTYHSFHHNTLGIVLGELGIPVWGIAATEKNAPEAPYTGRYMRMINGGSQAHFAGGSYLFTDEMRSLVRGVRQAFANGHCVVSLCDNPAPAGELPPVHLLGKRFHVGAGTLELAREAGVPVYFAILYPRPEGGWQLRFASGGPVQEVAPVLQAYFDFLQQAIEEAPWCWQGLSWWDQLPPG